MFPPVDVPLPDGDGPAMLRLPGEIATVSRYGSAWRISAWRVTLLQLSLGLVLSGLFWSESAHAYAWMIRHDYTACSSCHADPSGGELLTKYGRATSDLILSMQYGKGKPEAEDKQEKEESSGFEGPKTGVFWGALDLPDSLLLSGSFRNLQVMQFGEDPDFTFVPVMQADLYGQLKLGIVSFGGSIGMGKTSSPQHVRAAQLTTGQGSQVNMISRTHYVGVDLGKSFLLRAGRLNLPFGVRMPEHTTWVREATRTDRESDQQTGLALAYVGQKLRAEVMGIAGNYQMKLRPEGQFSDLKPGDVRERGYSMYAEGIAGTSFAAGVTSKVTFAKLDRLDKRRDTLRQAHGLTARWAAFPSLSFLAEADALFRSSTNAGYVGFAQAAWEPIQGLNLMLTGEVLDEGMAVQSEGEATPIAEPGKGQAQGGGWLTVDWFFYRQLEFRVDLVVRQNDPVKLLGQLHFYL